MCNKTITVEKYTVNLNAFVYVIFTFVYILLVYKRWNFFVTFCFAIKPCKVLSGSQEVDYKDANFDKNKFPFADIPTAKLRFSYALTKLDPVEDNGCTKFI